MQWTDRVSIRFGTGCYYPVAVRFRRRFHHQDCSAFVNPQAWSFNQTHAATDNRGGDSNCFASSCSSGLPAPVTTFACPSAHADSQLPTGDAPPFLLSVRCSSGAVWLSAWSFWLSTRSMVSLLPNNKITPMGKKRRKHTRFDLTPHRRDRDAVTTCIFSDS